jgi:ATP-dependent RNA helicase DeaD
MTVELSQKLMARGYAVDALNGDVKQAMREKIIQRLKNKSLDIVVATDVAARGLDVERLTMVVNYDMPHDAEAYIHRIGRTGRAGREGTALTLVSPRDQHGLHCLEKDIQQILVELSPPSARDVQAKRQQSLLDDVAKVLATQSVDSQKNEIERLMQQSECDAVTIAAALLRLLQKSQPDLDQKVDLSAPKKFSGGSDSRRGGEARRGYSSREGSSRGSSRDRPSRDRDSAPRGDRGTSRGSDRDSSRGDRRDGPPRDRAESSSDRRPRAPRAYGSSEGSSRGSSDRKGAGKPFAPRSPRTRDGSTKR